MATIGRQSLTMQSPLWTLLHPRGHGRALGAAVLAGGLVGALLVWGLGLPAWVAPALTVTLLSLPLGLKWRADRRLVGRAGMLLSILLITQGLHSVEHLAQWVQFHLLGWPAKAANGLISPLNAEVVHFTWNMAVLAMVVALLAGGMRGRWMWLLLLWAGAHTAEHVYLFVQFLEASWELRTAGLPLDRAQGLPGILGRNGWLLAQSATSPGARFLCTTLPGLVSAGRLDVHFGWNMGEMLLLLAAAHTARLPHRSRQA